MKNNLNELNKTEHHIFGWLVVFSGVLILLNHFMPNLIY